MFSVISLEKQSPETLPRGEGGDKAFQQILKPKPRLLLAIAAPPGWARAPGTLLQMHPVFLKSPRIGTLIWTAAWLSLGTWKQAGVGAVLFHQAQGLLLLPDLLIYLLCRCYTIPELKKQCTQVMEETSGASFWWRASVNEDGCAASHNSFKYSIL